MIFKLRACLKTNFLKKFLSSSKVLSRVLGRILIHYSFILIFSLSISFCNKKKKSQDDVTNTLPISTEETSSTPIEEPAPIKKNIEKEKQILSINSRLINAKSGLRLRKTPDLNSEKILLIQNGEIVELIEEKKEIVTINEVSGKWTKINYNGQKGWVFGGYLDKAK